MDNIDKKSIVELEKLVAEKRVSLRDIRFGVAGSKNKNVKEYKSVKREIAQLQTAIQKHDR